MGIKYTEISSGLRFPEGPIAMSDGSVILVEIERKTLTRIGIDGSQEIIAQLEGGPNGAALGPDGAVYICNNGGFNWRYDDDKIFPGPQAEDYQGGRIERVDIQTGTITTLYAECAGIGLRGPNDIVFDKTGGFWFTDLGKTRARERDFGGLYYATPDGNHIEEMIYPIPGGGNGIGLSPDEKTVYVAETPTGRLFGWNIESPGKLVPGQTAGFKNLVGIGSGYVSLDSLAVEKNGNICVATIGPGGITVFPPDGSAAEHVEVGDDPLTTNICFGGPDLQTAFITLSTTGRLIKCDWPRPGLELNFQQ